MGVIRGMMIMTATAYLDRAKNWTRTLEDHEALRSGVKVKEARTIVARKVGIAPGTLENLRNGRVKAIAAHIYDRLRAAVIGDLETELRRLTHELQILRQTGVDPRDSEMAEVASDLAKVRAALGLGECP